MTLDPQSLLDLKAKPPASRRKQWAPLDLTSLAPGHYLACDQSISALGVVILSVGTTVYIEHAASFTTHEVTSGWEDLLTRGEQLERRLEDWLPDRTPVSVPLFYVHEQPVMGNGKFLKPEIGLVASYAFRSAVRHRWPGAQMLPMVHRQHHASVICGKASTDKKAEHAELTKLFPQIRSGTELITNEATRDALCIGLVAAHDRRRIDG